MLRTQDNGSRRGGPCQHCHGTATVRLPEARGDQRPQWAVITPSLRVVSVLFVRSVNLRGVHGASFAYAKVVT